MIVSTEFINCFDIRYIANQMLKNGETFKSWQIKFLRENYHPDELDESLKELLNGQSFHKLRPRRGRPSAVLTNKELSKRVGIMLDYKIFLAEEKTFGKMKPKPEGTARERACERIATKYRFRRAARTLWDSMTKWRKEDDFMLIVHRQEARLRSKLNNGIES